MSHHDFSLNSHPREDMPEFTATVCRLILVHKVHINGVVWYFLIKLSVQVQ